MILIHLEKGKRSRLEDNTSLMTTIVSPLSEISENQLIEHVRSLLKNIECSRYVAVGLVRRPDDHLLQE